jgi:hypothetical protein
MKPTQETDVKYVAVLEVFKSQTGSEAPATVTRKAGSGEVLKRNKEDVARIVVRAPSMALLRERLQAHVDLLED